jgi:hypothetical protein
VLIWRLNPECSVIYDTANFNYDPIFDDPDTYNFEYDFANYGGLLKELVVAIDYLNNNDSKDFEDLKKIQELSKKFILLTIWKLFTKTKYA